MVFLNYFLLLTLSTHYVWTAVSDLDNRIEGFKKSKMTILSHQDEVANAFIRKFESNKQKSADQNKSKEVAKTLHLKNEALLNNETMDKEIENPIEKLLERVKGMKSDHEHPNLKTDGKEMEKGSRDLFLKKINESKEQGASKDLKQKGDEISDEKENKKPDNPKNLIANVLHEKPPNSVKSLGIHKDLFEKKESGQKPKTDATITPSQIESNKIHGASTSYGDFKDSSENEKSHENHNKPTQPLKEENEIHKSSAEYAGGNQDLSEQEGSDEKSNKPIVIEKDVAKNFRQNQTHEPSVEISKGIRNYSSEEKTQKEQLQNKGKEVPETLKFENEVLPNNETMEKEIENPIEKLLERVQGAKLNNHEHLNLKIDDNKRIKEEAKKALLKKINESKKQEANKENDNPIEKLLERVQDMQLSNHEHPNLKINNNKRIKEEAKEPLLKKINESKEQEASKENDIPIEKLLERVQGMKSSNHENPNLKIDETKRIKEKSKEALLNKVNESKEQEAGKENDNPIEKLLERVQGMKLSNPENSNLKIDETKRMEEEAREAFLKKINESKEKGASKEIKITDEQFCQTNSISDYDKICGNCINNSEVMRSLDLVYDESRKHEVDHKCIFKNVQICKPASNKSRVFKKMCAFSQKNELQNSKNGIIEPLSYRQAVLPCPVKKRLLPNDVIAGRYLKNEIYYVAKGFGRSCFILKDSKNEISILSYVKDQIQSINNLLNRDMQKSHSPKGQISQNTDPSPVSLHGRLDNPAVNQNSIRLPKNLQIDQLPPRIRFLNLKPQLQQIRTSDEHLRLKGPIKDKLNDIFLSIKNDLKEKSNEIHNQSRDIENNSHETKKDFKNFRNKNIKNSAHERSSNESEKNCSPIFKRIAESKLKNNSWNTSIDVDYIKRVLSDKNRQNQKNELKDDHEIAETEKNNVEDTRVHKQKNSQKNSSKNYPKSSLKHNANKTFDFCYPKKQADKNLALKNNAPRRRRRIPRRRAPKVDIPPIIKKSDDLVKPKRKNIPEEKTHSSRNINEKSDKSSGKFDNMSKKLEEAGETMKQLENNGILKDKNFSSKLNDISKKLRPDF